MRHVAIVGMLAGIAHADTPVMRPEATEVDRDRTPPGQGELGFDGGAPIGEWAVGVMLTELYRPVKFQSVDLTTYPVDHRETATLGGAIALGDDVIIDVKLPLSHQSGARLQGLGDDGALQAWVLGDTNVGLRIHAMTRGGFAMFVRGDLSLPTGADHEFAGEASWTSSINGILRVALPNDVVLAATAGARLRGKEVIVGDQLLSDELLWGIGATVGIPPFCSLWCRADQLKATAEIIGVYGDHSDGATGPSPIEARVGLIGRIRPPYAIAVHAGTHLDSSLGAPQFRATVDLVYQSL